MLRALGASRYKVKFTIIVKSDTKRLFIHAPNIHTGGGLKLLQGIITSGTGNLVSAQLDERARTLLRLPAGVTVKYVKPTFWSRLSAEWRLRYLHTEYLIVCPGGLPPLFSIRANAAVLALNRLLVDGSRLNHFPLWPRGRIVVERLWFLRCQGHATSYVAQTQSMAVLLKNILRSNTDVTVIPFNDPAPQQLIASVVPEKYDFVYPANGDAHKNHLRVLQAWRLLADRGLKPTLALTIDGAVYPALLDQILGDTRRFGLRITNLGYLTQPAIRDLYASSGALLFPSLTESFGLPLIEARERGLPIIAPELDYVRDVVSPTETFDPESPVSMARAIRRFMGQSEVELKIFSTKELITELLK